MSYLPVKRKQYLRFFEFSIGKFLYDGPFWKRFVKNNIVSVAKITQKKEPILLDSLISAIAVFMKLCFCFFGEAALSKR